MGRRGSWRGVEEGQWSSWPSSRNPRRYLKGAKRAKGANVLVPLVTDVTELTYTSDRGGDGRGRPGGGLQYGAEPAVRGLHARPRPPAGVGRGARVRVPRRF